MAENTKPAEPAKEAQPDADAERKLDALMERLQLKADPNFVRVRTGAAFIFMINGPIPPPKAQE